MTAAAGPRIADLDIRAVWAALGGGPLRGNRGRAFWRDGDGLNVALDSGRWFDHATCTGGGVPRLVETALGCDRRAALEWLAQNFGISSSVRHTPAERRAYARRLGAARMAAAELVERRDVYLNDLRTASALLLAKYHELMAASEMGGDIELAAQAETVFGKLDEMAARRENLQAATGPELVAFFDALETERAA